MGKLIVVEGIDGAGKSTFVKRLADVVMPTPFCTRQPDHPDIRRILHSGVEDPISQLCLLAADRRIHEDTVLKPKLKTRNVICDRYWWSTMAYQAEAIRIAGEAGWAIPFRGRIAVDLWILLDVEVEVAKERLRARAEDQTYFEAVPDATLRARRERYLHEATEAAGRGTTVLIIPPEITSSAPKAAVGVALPMVARVLGS